MDRVTAVERPTEIDSVRDFWNVEACGSNFIEGKRGTPEFYAKYRTFRYTTEWHIPLLVPFAETKGKRVLEIGCGNGADGTMFARAGADYTGVDLTLTAVEATRRHFAVLGLKGTFQTENAEHLSFPDEAFDFVYSHGVLHHTAHPERAFAEVHRVLRRGGRAVLMLYHQHSFNYYVRILGYMRARVLLRILTEILRPRSDPPAEMPEDIWQDHYKNFLGEGWGYLRAQNFTHHATDGPQCPIAHVYTRAKVRQAFRQFASIETKVAHFPLSKYGWAPRALERWLASRLGWYLFVYLVK